GHGSRRRLSSIAEVSMSTVIVTPATTNDLTVIATARAELGAPASVTDDEIQRLITDASQTCADLCGRPFGFGRVGLRQTMPFRLRRTPAAFILDNELNPTIASVTEDGVTLAPDEYELRVGGVL